MTGVLIVLAHPAIRRSRVNRSLREAVMAERGHADAGSWDTSAGCSAVGPEKGAGS